ncbi:MAG: hypothetical protein ABEI74_03930 [Candidatus Pacearchaeota archaeon]
MGVITKTRKIGGSLVATIPSNVINAEDIKEGEWIELEIKKYKKDYFGSLKELDKFEKEDRMEVR